MPIYTFENKKTGKRIERVRSSGDTTPPRGYIRVFDAVGLNNANSGKTRRVSIIK